MKEYLKIFWAFMKVGALTFGGGYAMLPILQREVVEHNGWATEEEIMDYYAMGQCLPGIIMVNTSVFVGRRHKGVAGGIAAGITVVEAALLNTALYAQTGSLLDLFSWPAIILAAVLWLLTNVVKPTKKLHPVVFIAASAVVGIVVSLGGA